MTCAGVCALGLGVIPVALPCALAVGVAGATLAVAYALGGEVERQRTWRRFLAGCHETYRRTEAMR